MHSAQKQFMGEKGSFSEVTVRTVSHRGTSGQELKQKLDGSLASCLTHRE